MRRFDWSACRQCFYLLLVSFGQSRKAQRTCHNNSETNIESARCWRNLLVNQMQAKGEQKNVEVTENGALVKGRPRGWGECLNKSKDPYEAKEMEFIVQIGKLKNE